ncbi:hypothetical protein Isop_1101 [Isosphaera pallida ATCC 43644]|uniref:Uncharacterized protein n=1 Tax=Isosphaera pallida (strain ATCC 43644 / DSM 9630 / IS1B) TaxID=575540 RepID=E8R4U3_ISOPI|nr:hypothetical protein [Isosphaera pallida]ADV61689.1 hypothetical protein Isop_1101 [Isosphaera pallida ATCC 43644]
MNPARPHDPFAPSDDDRDPADARGLFDDAPLQADRTPSGSIPPDTSGQSAYDLIDEPEDQSALARGRVGTPASSPTPRRNVTADVEVWTRQAEWGGDLLKFLLVLFLVLGLTGWLLVQLAFGLAFLTLILGLAVAALVAFPLILTLERPVRLVPEQALKEFYAALSHVRPHHKRMWLMLSKVGRKCRSFNDFTSFKTYWNQTLARLEGRRNQPKFLNPLRFEVRKFKSDHSKTRDECQATFEIHVSHARTGKHLAVCPGRMGLVRGPDRMWYLDRGTLPDPLGGLNRHGVMDGDDELGDPLERSRLDV